ncbi:MAG: hypothetical protein ACAI44_26980 [Candidatus Sericytochromatia bacterium]
MDSRLYRIYRFSVYAFGAVVAAGILVGTWFGLQMIQKHDQKFAYEREVKVKEHGPALANPFRNAATVEFHLPYLHGTDPNTVRYVTELSRFQAHKIKDGFVLPGEYRSGSINEKVTLNLACEGALCHLDFKLPARLVLTPQFDGRRYQAPKRTYQVTSHGYIFEVIDSYLAGIHPETVEEVAPFSDNLNVRPYYREAFYDSKGKWIDPRKK